MSGCAQIVDLILSFNSRRVNATFPPGGFPPGVMGDWGGGGGRVQGAEVGESEPTPPDRTQLLTPTLRTKVTDSWI